MHPAIRAQQTPDKPAVIMAETGRVSSFGTLEAQSNRTAQLLRRLGLKRGDVIALLLDNSVEFFELVWAAQRSGLHYVCLSTRLLPSEVEHILADSGARVLFAGARHAEAVAPQAQALGIVLFAVGEGGEGEGEDEGRGERVGRDFLSERAGMSADRIADESCGNDMLYSSGTTGRPKGIKPPLPDGPIDQPNGLTGLGAGLYGMDAATVFLSPAPLYHAAPLRWCMAVQKLGGTVVVMERFDAEAALALIERHRVSHAQWVPTHFVRMLKLDPEIRARFNLSSLRTVFHAAAPCPVEIKRAMIDWWGPIIHEFYGGTEANGLTSISAEEWLERPGSVGRPVWGVTRICDEEGNELPPGEVGSVYFADGCPFEYHNDPEKTKASRNRHGWTTIGDVGRVDDQGYLYLADRKDYMIISGGVNIYPQEIENQLVLHPAVADAAVIGAPDPDMGERVVAVVQPVEWARAGPDLARELTEWMAGRVGKLKLPRQVDFDPELPRTPTGKLVKRLLRDRYLRDGNPSAAEGAGAG